MDFADIDRKSRLRRKAQLKDRAENLGFPYVSQFIYVWYCKQGKRPKEIARALRVSYQSVYRWVTAWGFAPSRPYNPDNQRAPSFRGIMQYAPLSLWAVRTLWGAVLMQALKDIDRGGIDAPGALAWVENTQGGDCPSFIWVTELLELNPEATRKIIRDPAALRKVVRMGMGG